MEMPELPLRISEVSGPLGEVEPGGVGVVPSERGMSMTPVQRQHAIMTEEEEEEQHALGVGKRGKKRPSTAIGGILEKTNIMEVSGAAGTPTSTATSAEVLTTLSKQYKPLGIVTERTLRTIGQLKTAFQSRKQLSTFGLLGSTNKQVAARFFLELLILKTKDIINVQQQEPFGDIIISKSKAF